MEGIWSPAEQVDATGPIRHVYSWTLAGKFLRTNGLQDPGRSWDGFLGMEPKSGKLAWWGFFDNGSGGPVYLTEARDTVWKFAGENVGTDGKTTRHVTVQKIGEAKLKAEVRDVSNGQSTIVDQGIGRCISTASEWLFDSIATIGTFQI